jgi:hypothetical protein
MQNASIEQQGTVSRVLALSPDQAELVRRNYSRIFIVPGKEGVIDAILFQGSRPLESFIPHIARAIASAGLKTTGADLVINKHFDPKVALGLGQDHFVTNSWLVDEGGEAYDLFVELDAVWDTEAPEMISYDGDRLEGMAFAPLCFKLGIEDLSPSWDGLIGTNLGDDIVRTDTTENNNGANNDQTQTQMDQGRGTPGRVTDPSTDRRLKANRGTEVPKQPVIARQTQDSDAGGTPTRGRMAGRPGRVKHPELDGRLKNNRRQTAGADGGR